MSELRLGIDAAALSKPLSGIGRYLFEICKRLDGLLPEARFVAYSPIPLAVTLPSDRWTVRVGGTALARFGSTYLWLKLWVARMAAKDGVDIFWGPRTILPGPSSAFSTVSTVHDLNYRIFPASMPYATLWAHRFWFAADVRRADRIVTNSGGTRGRLHDLLDVQADAIAPPGISSTFAPQSAARVADRLNAFGVDRPYFLAVGTLEPRKNLPALIDAFVSIKREGELAEHRLIIVGASGWRRRRARSRLAAAGDFGVRWLGFVPDEDLAVLYTGAHALVFPSVYEGFGIPAAEALACGARVVASDLPELREAAGPQGIYIPATVAGIRAGLLAAVRADSVAPAAPRDWMVPAQVMANLFRKLYQDSPR